MIRTFRSKDTAQLFSRQRVRHFQGFEPGAREKLLLLHAATDVKDLRIPPGNRLEKLKGDRAGQWSIRINRQWRVCFTWREGNAYDVEIVDYH